MPRPLRAIWTSRWSRSCAILGKSILPAPLARGLPRPTGAQFRQATFAAADDLARETGSALVIDGGGGDNMFCSLQSVAPVVDALFGMGMGSRPLATAASIARMAQVSLATVLARAGVRLVTRRAAYRWPVDHSLLDPFTADGLDPSHPWLKAPRGTPPGKAAQVGLLLAAMAVADGLDPDRHPALLSPLVSQPIAEAALRVPSWMWFEEGLLREVMYNTPAQLLDSDADNKVADADQALQVLGSDHVAFGYLTTTITVSDRSREGTTEPWSSSEACSATGARRCPRRPTSVPDSYGTSGSARRACRRATGG